MEKVWKSWHYKNLTILAISIIFAIFLSWFKPFHDFLLGLGNWGYLGAFIAGILFVSTFTVATGAVILLVLAESLSPLELAIIGGAGGVVGDFIIFKYIKDSLINELEPIYEDLGGNHLTKTLHTKYFSWLLPVVGAAIIASPLPDEVGVSLIGLSKMSTFKFLGIAFLLDILSVFLVISASSFIKP